MIAKLVGAAVVAACLGGACIEARRHDAAALARIDGFMRLIAFARSEVDCFLAPQGRILEKCGARMLADCGWQGGAPPEELMSLAECARPGLEAEAWRVIAPFCASFGRGFREEQLRLCDACLSSLGAVRARLEAELPHRRRASLSIVISAAAAAALILF